MRGFCKRFAAAAIGYALLYSTALGFLPTRSAVQHPSVSESAEKDARAYFAEVRRDKAALRAFLRRMPKGAELHTHLAGMPGPDRLLELAAQSKRFRYYVRFPKQPSTADDPNAYTFVALPLDVPAPQDPGAAFIPAAALLRARSEEERAQLAAFRRAHTIAESDAHPLDIFYGATFRRRDAIVSNLELVLQLVADAVRQAHRNHVSYIELQLDPFPAEPGVNTVERDRAINLIAARENLNMLIAAAQAANEPFPEAERVEVRFLLAFSRTTAKIFTKLPIAFELAADSDAIAAAIAGINIVGNEYSQDAHIGQEIAGPAELRDYMLTLHRIYPKVRLSIHAGEGTRWDWHIRDSILIGAERIGHGTNLAMSPQANSPDQDLLRRNHILIEACITSNHLLLGVPLMRHPFLSYLRAGISVSLNSDDGGIFETDMTEEFARAAENYPDLSWEELKQLARAGLEHAFVSDANKQELLSHWEAEMRLFEAPQIRD